MCDFILWTTTHLSRVGWQGHAGPTYLWKMWRLERLKHGPNFGEGSLSMLCRLTLPLKREMFPVFNIQLLPQHVCCPCKLACWLYGCMHVWSFCCFHTFPFSELKLRVQDLWRYPSFLMWWRFPSGSFCAEKRRQIFVGRVYLHSHFLSFLSNKPILKISEVGGGGFTFFFHPYLLVIGEDSHFHPYFSTGWFNGSTSGPAFRRISHLTRPGLFLFFEPRSGYWVVWNLRSEKKTQTDVAFLDVLAYVFTCHTNMVKWCTVKCKIWHFCSYWHVVKVMRLAQYHLLQQTTLWRPQHSMRVNFRSSGVIAVL